MLLSIVSDNLYADVPVSYTHLVGPPAEIPNEQIAAHLQVSHRALEVLLPALAESGLSLEFKEEPLVFGQ